MLYTLLSWKVKKSPIDPQSISIVMWRIVMTKYDQIDI